MQVHGERLQLRQSEHRERVDCREASFAGAGSPYEVVLGSSSRRGEALPRAQRRLKPSPGRGGAAQQERESDRREEQETITKTARRGSTRDGRGGLGRRRPIALRLPLPLRGGDAGDHGSTTGSAGLGARASKRARSARSNWASGCSSSYDGAASRADETTHENVGGQPFEDAFLESSRAVRGTLVDAAILPESQRADLTRPTERDPKCESWLMGSEVELPAGGSTVARSQRS